MSSDGEHPKHWTTVHEQTVSAHDYLRQVKDYADEALKAWRNGDLKLTRNRLKALRDSAGEATARLDCIEELTPGATK